MGRRLEVWIAGLLLLLGAAPAGAQRCEVNDPLRRPFFGDLHVHSSYSFDAYLFETRNAPRDAYAFAKGAEVGLPPLDAMGNPTRMLQLRRPLDFAAVTDHSELLGETSICTTPTHPDYGAPFCQLFRTDPDAAFGVFGSILASDDPERLPFCGDGGLGCLSEAGSIWADIQAAADEHQDRSPDCRFTTFTGYEWTGSPDGNGLHRNVVFRGEDVPALPLSYVEASRPEQLWSALEQQCAIVGGDCDAVSIPHNSNKSGGLMFDPLGSDGQPMTAAEAALRARVEPLVEIVQHKGDSECRFQVGTSDEQCDFEKTTTAPPASDAPLSYVRNALRAGLALGAQLGVNPYALGFVAATDTHLGTPGATDEDDYAGHAGTPEGSPAARLQPGTKLNNPGGLSVLWAEENTRQALFDAMRRRESYATSGTRPVVRFFGGYDYPADLCDQSDFAEQGYAGGVPMGGQLAHSTGATPRFAALAMQDPGTEELQGIPLQRIQIVKGWLDASGTTNEKVFDVAGSDDDGASLDLTTCEVTGGGYGSLCTVWEDPEFDPAEPAFYYARVLETESCRWSTWLCNEQQVDCSGTPPPGFEACCDGSLPATIQERAYTSPIWYSAVAAVPVPLPGWSSLPVCVGLLLAARSRRRRPAPLERRTRQKRASRQGSQLTAAESPAYPIAASDRPR